MESAEVISVIGAGVFFLVALLTGVWKYLQMRASETATAHPYVDIAHRASLLYSFAAMLLARFVQISQLSPAVEFWAVLFPLFYFANAILIYIVHGILRDTDNQLKRPYRVGKIVLPSVMMAGFMWSLIVAEIGGFLVIFYGVLMAVSGIPD